MHRIGARRLDLSKIFDQHIRSANTSALPDDMWETALAGPAEAFLVRQGKGVRKTLVDAVYQMCDGSGDECSSDILAIVELIHAASLVIDDIEDESITRRGGPTLHHQYGIPVALNTGCAFYFAALDMLSHLNWPSDNLVVATRAVHRCLVVGHLGQALDLSVRVWDLAPAHIPVVVQEVTEKKTSTLMSVCATLGALDAHAEPMKVRAAAALGHALGTLLQMLDDLGSVLRPERRDKGWEDLRHGRPVWPWAWLCMVENQNYVTNLLRQTQRPESSSDIGRIMDELAAKVAAIGRQSIGNLKNDTLETAEAELGRSSALESLWQLVERMESAYV